MGTSRPTRKVESATALRAVIDRENGMPAFNRKLFILFATLGALAACSNAASTASPAGPAKASVDAKTYCAKLQPAVQSNMKIPLSLF